LPRARASTSEGANNPQIVHSNKGYGIVEAAATS
jgi:hypothetical protein